MNKILLTLGLISLTVLNAGPWDIKQNPKNQKEQVKDERSKYLNSMRDRMRTNMKMNKNMYKKENNIIDNNSAKEMEMKNKEALIKAETMQNDIEKAKSVKIETDPGTILREKRREDREKRREDREKRRKMMEERWKKNRN